MTSLTQGLESVPKPLTFYAGHNIRGVIDNLYSP